MFSELATEPPQALSSALLKERERDIHEAAQSTWDVVVVGGGNAALVAAITAARAGRKVLLLEAAPIHLRGGNTRHTRNIRAAHDNHDRFVVGTYSADELLNDLRSVSSGQALSELATFTATGSSAAVRWMTENGVRWQPPLRGTLALSRTNRFFLGGGTALINHYFRVASALGVTIVYEAPVRDLTCTDSHLGSVIVRFGEKDVPIVGRAYVVACGGFEANHDWLRRCWGAAADNYVVRGTPHNDGSVLQRLIDFGAVTCGDSKGFHAVAVDARSPAYDGGIATRIDSIPFGIVVNSRADRFADEGLDIWPKRYASWGGLIATQPGQIAFAIFDSAAWGKFIPPLYPPLRASTLCELAHLLGLDPASLEQTVVAFNSHVHGESRLDLASLDGVGTVGLDPPKSNWASLLSRPPFFAFPARTGITFTYLGLRVDEQARVLHAAHGLFSNVFAAGEIMSGNVLTRGYLAGFGLTIGTVFGRLAGLAASEHAA